MTSKKLFTYFFVQFVILAILKLLFFNYDIFSNAGFQQIIFWLLVVVTGYILVGRFGIINFFESFFIIVVWVVGDLFLDLLITGRFISNPFFSTKEYWAGALLLALSVFLFHKKRHIHVRHELHAKAHAAARPHGHDDSGAHSKH